MYMSCFRLFYFISLYSNSIFCIHTGLRALYWYAVTSVSYGDDILETYRCQNANDLNVTVYKMNHQIMQIQHGSHNERYGVSNHQPRDYLLSRLFRRKSKKTSKLRVTGLCAGNSPVTGEFPTQRASNAENVSIWWRHYASRDLVVSKGQSVSIFDLASNQVVIMGSLNISMG